MKAYSMDFRLKTIEAYEDGEGTQEEIAHRFKISYSTFKRWCKQKKIQGHVNPSQAKRGFAPLFSGENEVVLRKISKEYQDATLDEYVEILDQNYGIQCHSTTICKALKRLGLTRKKNTASRRARQRRRERTKKSLS